MKSKILGLLLVSAMLLSQAVGYASGCIHAPPEKAKLEIVVTPAHDQQIAVQSADVTMSSPANIDLFVLRIAYVAEYIKSVYAISRTEKERTAMVSLFKPPNLASKKGLIKIRTFDC